MFYVIKTIIYVEIYFKIIIVNFASFAQFLRTNSDWVKHEPLILWS